jgi:hypothetical protein
MASDPPLPIEVLIDQRCQELGLSDAALLRRTPAGTSPRACAGSTSCAAASSRRRPP